MVALQYLVPSTSSVIFVLNMEKLPTDVVLRNYELSNKSHDMWVRIDEPDIGYSSTLETS